MIRIERDGGYGHRVHAKFEGADLDAHDFIIAMHIQTTLAETGGDHVTFNRTSLRVIQQALHEFIDNKAASIEARQRVEKQMKALRAERDPAEPETEG